MTKLYKHFDLNVDNNNNNVDIRKSRISLFC